MVGTWINFRIRSDKLRAVSRKLSLPHLIIQVESHKVQGAEFLTWRVGVWRGVVRRENLEVGGATENSEAKWLKIFVGAKGQSKVDQWVFWNKRENQATWRYKNEKCYSWRVSEEIHSVSLIYMILLSINSSIIIC